MAFEVLEYVVEILAGGTKEATVARIDEVRCTVQAVSILAVRNVQHLEGPADSPGTGDFEPSRIGEAFETVKLSRFRQ